VNHVQVAQAARTVLQIWFEIVCAVFETVVAVFLFQQLAFDEAARIEARMKQALKRLEQLLVSPQHAGFEQRGFDGDVIVGLACALLRGAYAVADFESYIPAALHPDFEARTQLRVGFVRNEQQHVHVGGRKQFVAAIAAHGREAGPFGQQYLAKPAQHFVDVAGVALQVMLRIRARAKFGSQYFTPLSQLLAQRGQYGGCPGRHAQAAWAMKSGGSGLSADVVSTS